MDGCNLAGDGSNALTGDTFAGHDAIAVSGRGHTMAASLVHAPVGALEEFNLAYADFRADRGIPPGCSLDPKKIAGNRGRPIPGAEYRPHFFRHLLRFLDGDPRITITPATGSHSEPRGLVNALLAERSTAYKLAASTGIAIIRGDLAGPPRTELTGLAIPRAIDTDPLKGLLEVSRMIAYLVRDRHFPNPNRKGLGAALDALLPRATGTRA